MGKIRFIDDNTELSAKGCLSGASRVPGCVNKEDQHLGTDKVGLYLRALCHGDIFSVNKAIVIIITRMYFSIQTTVDLHLPTLVFVYMPICCMPGTVLSYEALI